jgi:hypothetical protein
MLDSIAEKYLIEVDAKLKIAESKTIEYIVNSGFTYQVYEGIKDSVQKEINDISIHANSIESANKIISDRIYMYYAYEELENLDIQYVGNIVMPLYSDGLIEGIATEINFQLKDGFDESIINEAFYLKLKLNIMPFRYSVTQTNNKMNVNLNNDRLRYKINAWNQWNTPIES